MNLPACVFPYRFQLPARVLCKAIATFVLLCSATVLCPAQSAVPTTTALTVSANGGAPESSYLSINGGTPVLFTAAVKTQANVPVTAGQVVFCNVPLPRCTDIHRLGVAQLMADGTARLTLRPQGNIRYYEAYFVGTKTALGSVSQQIEIDVNPISSSKISVTTALTASATSTGFTATVAISGHLQNCCFQVSLVDLDSPHSWGAIINNVMPAPVAIGSTTNLPGTNDLAQIAVGDINNDGIADLVSVNGTAIVVLLSNGDGTFTQLSPVATGGQVTGLVLGDFNSDGKLDVAALNPLEGLVSVLLGHGDGYFDAPKTSVIDTTGTFFGAGILTTDFNLDGIPDLFTNNTIFLGHNDGTFTAGSGSIYTARGPVTKSIDGNDEPGISGVVGDFNNDGFNDVVSSVYNSIQTCLGKADGTCTVVTTPTPDRVTSLVAADFNSDGVLDVAVTLGSASVQIYLGKGDGTFTAGDSVNQPGVLRVAGLGDFDGFNNADLAVVISPGTNGGRFLFTRSSDGTFDRSPAGVVVGGYFNVQDSLSAVGKFGATGLDDFISIQHDGNEFTLVQVVEAGNGSVVLNEPLDPGSGSHRLQAFFPDQLNYLASQSNIVTVQAPASTGRHQTSTTLSASPTHLQAGGVTTLTAIVTDLSSNPQSPVGTVTFIDPSAGLTIGTSAVQNGVATIYYRPGANFGQPVVGTIFHVQASFTPADPTKFTSSSDTAGTYLYVNVSNSLTLSIPTHTYGDPVFFLQPQSNSPVQVTYRILSGPGVMYGQRLQITGAGNIVVQAHQDANSTYSAATVTTAFTVQKATQTIQFVPPPSMATVGANPIRLAATASSGLPITFSVLSGPGVISGDTLTLTGPGYITVSAQQPGNGNYFPSPRQNYQIKVNAAP